MSYPQFQAASDYLGAIADEDYVKALPSNSYEDRGGAVLFNLSDTDREICLNMEELSGREPDKDSYEFTELWSGEVLHSGKEALTVVVPAHGTKVFSV